MTLKSICKPVATQISPDSGLATSALPFREEGTYLNTLHTERSKRQDRILYHCLMHSLYFYQNGVFISCLYRNGNIIV